MNSLIDHILDIRDDKDALTKVWIGFELLVFPEVLPQQYKPTWWDVYPGDYKPVSDSDRLQMRTYEGRKWGFGDTIQQYIETIIPNLELQEALRAYLITVNL